MPRFSILTPTRDRPEWLGRCIESVLAQDADFEHIIYDNGAVPSVVPDDPRIRYERGPASGPADAFQRALDLATGVIVTPLGDDDVLAPGALEVVDAAIGEHEWLTGMTRVLDASGVEQYMLGGCANLADLADGYYLGGAIYWRRALTDRLGGFDSAFDGAADFDLYTRFVVAAEPAFVPDVLYVYTEHPDTDSRRNGPRQLEAAERVRARIRDLLAHAEPAGTSAPAG